MNKLAVVTCLCLASQAACLSSPPCYPTATRNALEEAWEDLYQMLRSYNNYCAGMGDGLTRWVNRHGEYFRQLRAEEWRCNVQPRKNGGDAFIRSVMLMQGCYHSQYAEGPIKRFLRAANARVYE